VWNDAGGASFIPQSASPGDATPELSTDNISVVAETIGQLLGVPVVSPNPFTPNGDSVNDAVVFTFGLYLVTEPVEVRVEIHDLSGRRVRLLGPLQSSAGQVRLAWDGTSDSGAPVPPGIYLYRLFAQDDQGAGDRTGTLAVAY
ncbi:MAG: FlgD immunoglobulin-like domain containing protein, partial [Gemmatimonadota bacterium]